MSPNQILWVTVAGIILIAGAWYWNHESRAQNTSAETIRIGAVLSLTGEAATDALNMKRGIELAKEDLAKRGVTVDISYQDDKTDPKETVSAFQYLLATYHPQAIIGPTWSFLESAAASTIASGKVIAYAPAVTSEFASVVSPYQFQGAPHNSLLEQPLAAWLKANGKKRVAIVVSDDPWGESVAAPFRAAAKDAGTTIVVDEKIQSLSPDAGGAMASILLKVKAQKADAILWTGYEQDATALVKKRRELNIDASIVDHATTLESLLSRNVVVPEQLTDAYLITASAPIGFVKKFQARYGEAPGTYADRAYDSLMILVEAIQKSPNKDADSLANYLRTKLDYTGVDGTYQFNEKGDVTGGQWTIEPMIKS